MKSAACFASAGVKFKRYLIVNAIKLVLGHRKVNPARSGMKLKLALNQRRVSIGTGEFGYRDTPERTAIIKSPKQSIGSFGDVEEPDLCNRPWNEYLGDELVIEADAYNTNRHND